MARPVKSELVTHDGTMYVRTVYTDDNSTSMCTSVSVNDVWLNIVENQYDNSLMLHADSIPYLIKALQKLQRQAKKA